MKLIPIATKANYRILAAAIKYLGHYHFGSYALQGPKGKITIMNCTQRNPIMHCMKQYPIMHCVKLDPIIHCMRQYPIMYCMK